MAYDRLKRLTSPTLLASSTESTIYSAPTGKASEIVMVWLHNTHGSAVDIELWLPAAIGAEGNKRLAISLEPNESFEFSPKVPFVLEGDESVRLQASVDAVVSVIVIGREEL